ncbi:amidase [Hansschlegelia sp. KR7-227]|uniref:amidase n=1 Tax=Hansschlegelia sp. KR7-227 TaxID=3400914 RepID=UPI003BFBED07
MTNAATIAAIQSKIARGAAPQDLVTTLWERARSLEPSLQAFAHLPDSPPEAGEAGPLAGVAVGVKDLIDTADMPTGYGSPIHDGHRPAADAAIVARLRALGATVLGKTVTTEFAWRHPGPTRNPWNLAHTPGGSSSGSAAAVAAGLVTLALGTQTFGSVIRPAAFCGVVGFKPSFGALPREGVHPLSPSLDHVGLFARTVDDVSAALSLLAPDIAPASSVPVAELRLAALTPSTDVASEEQRALVDSARQDLASAGARVETVDLSDMTVRLRSIAEIIVAFEAAQVFGELQSRRPADISGELTDLINGGRAISDAAHRDALAAQRDLREAFADRMRGYDAVLTIPAPGEAPEGLGHTGDARFCTPWTTLGAPAVSLPVGVSLSGLPLGLQLVGRHGGDMALLAAAQTILQVVPLFAGAPHLEARS